MLSGQKCLPITISPVRAPALTLMCDRTRMRNHNSTSENLYVCVSVLMTLQWEGERPAEACWETQSLESTRVSGSGKHVTHTHALTDERRNKRNTLMPTQIHMWRHKDRHIHHTHTQKHSILCAQKRN